MAKTQIINGKVVYKNIGTGFWGIEDNQGNEWLPINLPTSLQKEGKEVSLKVKELKEEVSMFMWGTPVKIVK